MDGSQRGSKVYAVLCLPWIVMAEDKVYDDSAYYAQQYGQQIPPTTSRLYLHCMALSWILFYVLGQGFSCGGVVFHAGIGACRLCKAGMMVGSARFERAISASRTQNPTKLDHDPVKFSKLSNLSLTVNAVTSCATRMPNVAAHAADPACDCCRVQESSRAAGVDKSGCSSGRQGSAPAACAVSRQRQTRRVRQGI